MLSEYAYLQNEYVPDYYGYIGEAPTYYYNYTPPNLSFAIDNEGNITTEPVRDDYSVVLAGDYIHISIPVIVNVSLSLPYGWTYEVEHIVGSSSSYDDEMSEQRTFVPSAYTAITVNHTWNTDSGFIGIEPAAVIGTLPAGFTQASLPANASMAQWNTTLGVSGNRIVSVTGPQPNMPTITIPAGRHIIVTSSGTNVNGNEYDHIAPATRQTLTRNTEQGRHFVVHDGGTLTLSHIILYGGVYNPPPQGTRINRGGVQVGGVPGTPTASLDSEANRTGGARLVISRGQASGATRGSLTSLSLVQLLAASAILSLPLLLLVPVFRYPAV